MWTTLKIETTIRKRNKIGYPQLQSICFVRLFCRPLIIVNNAYCFNRRTLFRNMKELKECVYASEQLFCVKLQLHRLKQLHAQRKGHWMKSGIYFIWIQSAEKGIWGWYTKAKGLKLQPYDILWISEDRDIINIFKNLRYWLDESKIFGFWGIFKYLWFHKNCIIQHRNYNTNGLNCSVWYITKKTFLFVLADHNKNSHNGTASSTLLWKHEW